MKTKKKRRRMIARRRKDGKRGRKGERRTEAGRSHQLKKLRREIEIFGHYKRK